LQTYRGQLWQVAGGGLPDSRWRGVFEPLAQAIQAHHLPISLLDDLLSAFLQDIHNPAYRTRADLLDYCRLSAQPVGRLLLHLHHLDTPQALSESDAICSALQLINFWQDLSVDLPRQRCYVPLEDLARMGLSFPLSTTIPSAQARALIQPLCAWAEELMLTGAPLVHRLPGRAGWELRLVVQGGLRILEKIARMDFDTLNRRPTLGASDAFPLLWRSLWMHRKVQP
jgi:squalene synthase HpnC